MSEREDQTEWRYLSRGVARHAIRGGGQVQHFSLAQCGRQPGLGQDWHGTGSQAEYEHCASLPECGRCLMTMGRCGQCRKRGCPRCEREAAWGRRLQRAGRLRLG